MTAIGMLPRNHRVGRSQGPMQGVIRGMGMLLATGVMFKRAAREEGDR